MRVITSISDNQSNRIWKCDCENLQTESTVGFHNGQSPKNTSNTDDAWHEQYIVNKNYSGVSWHRARLSDSTVITVTLCGADTRPLNAQLSFLISFITASDHQLRLRCTWQNVFNMVLTTVNRNKLICTHQTNQRCIPDHLLYYMYLTPWVNTTETHVAIFASVTSTKWQDGKHCSRLNLAKRNRAFINHTDTLIFSDQINTLVLTDASLNAVKAISLACWSVTDIITSLVRKCRL